MSFSFYQPDAATSWQWTCGNVRSTHEMFADTDAALNLLEKTIEFDAADSQVLEARSPDALPPSQAGFLRGNASVEGDAYHVDASNSALSSFREPLWVGCAGFWLQQIVLIQEAVSVAIVTSQHEQCPSESDSWENLSANLVRAELEHANDRWVMNANSYTFLAIHLLTDHLSGLRCCQCDWSGQQSGLWLTVDNAAGRSFLLFPVGGKADNAESDSVQNNEQLFTVSLGIETKTLHMGFDGEQFVKVTRSAGDAEVVVKSSTGSTARSSSGSGESCADKASGGKEEKSPLMQLRNESLWGPHWTEAAEGGA